MIILVIGDLHVPLRSHGIPAVFKENLGRGQIHKILCTGNLCTKDELEELKAKEDKGKRGKNKDAETEDEQSNE